MSTFEKIPFQVDISRIIEVLANQIYQSPFALLRENTQNSYDAVLLRKQLTEIFEPQIKIEIAESFIRVSDNGIGMTAQDLKEHYWRAGASSKNTPEARKAGVVGTFGIGAMANFGIAEELEVITESAITGERTKCVAKRSTLSAIDDCISFESLPTMSDSGTRVTAIIQSGISIPIGQAEKYIEEFVMFLPFFVSVNDRLVSQQPYNQLVPPLVSAWEERLLQVELGGAYKADITLQVNGNGEVRVLAENLSSGGQSVQGSFLLKQGQSSLRTFRTGFGLANTAVHSVYQFGGVADLQILQPTAGREALTTESLQMLQEWMTKIDNLVSEHIALRPESNMNTHFMQWVVNQGRYELCGHLKPTLRPDRTVTLQELRESTVAPVLVYEGRDPATIALASDDRPMVVLSYSQPRRQCEIEYLRRYCLVELLSDNPRVISAKSESDWTFAEAALVFRLVNILLADYFVSAKIELGEISHGLPILVTERSEPIRICLSPEGQSLKLLLSIYDSHYQAFDSMAKDFARTNIFPHISDLVPSSTRQGAEAFLRTIQRGREVFEYESNDSDSLTSIWQDYAEGRISFQDAATRSADAATQGTQVIDGSAAANVRDVVPDIIENSASLQSTGLADQVDQALPPIRRLEIETDRKLLTINTDDVSLQGYRCFLAISDRIREDRGEFFLQPHKTSIVWGGQRVLFVFEHHSGKFGVYYDLQSDEIIAATSGGRAFATCTIIMKNRIFIPIPEEIQAAFVPGLGERKKFHVRCDILYTT